MTCMTSRINLGPLCEGWRAQYKDSLKTLGDKEKCRKAREDEIKKKEKTVADLIKIKSDEMEKNISAENKGEGNEY